MLENIDRQETQKENVSLLIYPCPKMTNDISNGLSRTSRNYLETSRNVFSLKY